MFYSIFGNKDFVDIIFSINWISYVYSVTNVYLV